MRDSKRDTDVVGQGEGGMILGEWHWNMYIIMCEMNGQSMFDAWYRVLGAGALGWPRGMGWGGRFEGGSRWGTHVHPWWIHVSVWQNQYNIVKLKKKKDCYTTSYNLKCSLQYSVVDKCNLAIKWFVKFFRRTMGLTSILFCLLKDCSKKVLSIIRGSNYSS